MSVAVFLSTVCFLLCHAQVSVSQSTTDPCFAGCGVSTDSISSCLSYDWNCAANEFCEAHAVGGRFYMQCTDAGLVDAANFVNCSLRHHANDPSCDLLQPGRSVGHTCSYCCGEKHCFEKLIQYSRSTTLQDRLALNGCYNNCTMGDGPDSCSADHWTCQQNELCSVVIPNDDKVNTACVVPGETCFIDELLNDENCTSKLSDPSVNVSGVCTFCCANHICVYHHVFEMRTATTTQSATSLPTATTTAAITATTPLPPTTYLFTTAGTESEGHSCFTSPCPLGADPAACAAGDWACADDEFCQVHTYVDGSLRMSCTPTIYATVCTEPLADFYCPLEEDFLVKNCSKCCPERSCVDNIINFLSPATTTALTTVGVRPPTSCFQDCNRHMSIASCLGQAWKCHGDQFCEVHLSGDGMINVCRDGTDNFLACSAKQFGNAPSCNLNDTRLAHGGICYYCCSDRECFERFIQQSTTLPPSIAVTTTPSAQTKALAGNNSCFETHCLPGSDSLYCTSGQWACGDDEFCHVFTSFQSGTFQMSCSSLCMDAHVCPHAEDYLQKNCSTCCTDRQCVHDVINSLQDQGLAADKVTTSTQETTTSLLTASEEMAVSVLTSTPQSTTDCENVESDSWCSQFVNLCSQSSAAQVCAKTCHLCDHYPGATPITTTPAPTHTGVCADTYAEDWCLRASKISMCDDIIVAQLCAQTCQLCVPAETSTVPPETSSTTSSTDSPTEEATTSATTIEATSFIETIAATATAATTTATITLGNATTAELVEALTTAAATESSSETVATITVPDIVTLDSTLQTSTAVQVAGACAVCSGLDCLMGHPGDKPCPSDHPYCITTIIDTDHGRDNILRGCASHADCEAIPLMAECRGANAILNFNITCQFCCKEPNCNAPPSLIPNTGLITKH